MKNAPHLGLARKCRPQTFDEVVGQEAVTVTLKNAVGSGKPAHAYLFFGPRGVGKTTTARILAKALNCEKGPTPEPCGACPACAEIAASSSIDVLELDAATHTQVDRIREMIIETVSLAPSRDRYKVFIIDEVHMLSAASFNALLKTLEEPPSHVVFILATTTAGKIPATIVSRCQRFRFRPMPVEVLSAHLKELAKREKIKADIPALDRLARAAGGSLRDAVSLLDQAHAYCGGAVGENQVTELLGILPEESLHGLAAAILGKDAKAVSTALGRLWEEGHDPAQVLRDLRERLQEAYLDRLGVEGGLDGRWKTLAAAHPAETFSFLVRRLNRALEEVRSADSPRLALELALFGAIEAAYDLREWVARLEALEKRISEPGSSAASPLPAPVSVPVLGPVENVWPAVIHRLREEKPGLASELEGARLMPGERGQWRLVFKRAFEMDRAKKNQTLLEAKLATAVGHPISLIFEVGQGAARDAGDAARSDPEWEPVEQGGAVEDPGVKKVLQVFPGAIRHEKKKT